MALSKEQRVKAIDQIYDAIHYHVMAFIVFNAFSSRFDQRPDPMHLLNYLRATIQGLRNCNEDVVAVLGWVEGTVWIRAFDERVVGDTSPWKYHKIMVAVIDDVAKQLFNMDETVRWTSRGGFR